MARGAFDKKALVRDMDREQESRLRKKVATLRKRATEARRERKRRLREQKAACKKRRQKAEQTAQQAFRKALAHDRDVARAATLKRNAVRQARLTEAREVCALERADIDAELTAAIDLAAAEAAEERKWLRELTGMNRSVRALDRKRARGGARSSSRRREERRQESDDEVRTNLAPHEIAIFNRVRDQIHGSRLKSRTEAFQQWLEENPEELHLAKAEPSDAQYAAAEAEWLAERAFQNAAPARRRAAGDGLAPSVPLADEVPF